MINILDVHGNPLKLRTLYVEGEKEIKPEPRAISIPLPLCYVSRISKREKFFNVVYEDKGVKTFNLEKDKDFQTNLNPVRKDLLKFFMSFKELEEKCHIDYPLRRGYVAACAGSRQIIAHGRTYDEAKEKAILRFNHNPIILYYDGKVMKGAYPPQTSGHGRPF